MEYTFALFTAAGDVEYAKWSLFQFIPATITLHVFLQLLRPELDVSDFARPPPRGVTAGIVGSGFIRLVVGATLSFAAVGWRGVGLSSLTSHSRGGDSNGCIRESSSSVAG